MFIYRHVLLSVLSDAVPIYSIQESKQDIRSAVFRRLHIVYTHTLYHLPQGP